MAKHHITYACGHSGIEHLSGPSSERTSRARYLARSDCRSCWEELRDQEYAEQAERSATANRAAGLPELEGSPKQVAWAETIRAKLLDGVTRRQAELTEALEAPDPVYVPRRTERLAQFRIALAALSEIADARWYIYRSELDANGMRRMVAQGLIRPRTQAEKSAGYDPFGLNTLTFPDDEVIGRVKGARTVRLRLVNSRWEGCTVAHPVSMTQEEPDGALRIRFRGDWEIGIDDGARTRIVSGEDFYHDRAQRRDEPGERHYWGIPPYVSSRWNEIDVPEEDVTERAGQNGPLAVVRLVRSRWEGLYFEHPLNQVRHHRPGLVTIRFKPGWEFNVRGGRKTLRVSGWEMYQDRDAPLPEPGESLAVEPTQWHGVTFHPSRVRRIKGYWLARFPMNGAWAESAVFHRASMCRRDEDGDLVWRFPDDWNFRIRTPDAGTVEMSAQDFLKATAGWSWKAPRPGTYTREPDVLAATGDIPIPPELLEEDPLIAEGA